MTDTLASTNTVPAGFDFTDPDLYASRVPLEEFAELRQNAPIFWNAQTREMWINQDWWEHLGYPGAPVSAANSSSSRAVSATSPGAVL